MGCALNDALYHMTRPQPTLIPGLVVTVTNDSDDGLRAQWCPGGRSIAATRPQDRLCWMPSYLFNWFTLQAFLQKLHNSIIPKDAKCGRLSEHIFCAIPILEYILEHNRVSVFHSTQTSRGWAKLSKLRWKETACTAWWPSIAATAWLWRYRW